MLPRFKGRKEGRQGKKKGGRGASISRSRLLSSLGKKKKEKMRQDVPFRLSKSNRLTGVEFCPEEKGGSQRCHPHPLCARGGKVHEGKRSVARRS